MLTVNFAMNTQSLEPLERLEFDAAELVTSHPPRWFHPHKELVYRLSCPPEQPPDGRLVYSRWAEMLLPEVMQWRTNGCVVEVRADVFDYQPVGVSEPGMEWHLNFADPHLFVAYGSSLLAQDEMQVAEHPALGSLHERLVASGRRPLTVDGGHSTPVLVRGVERRCRLATEPNPTELRPHGLYGNAFAAASAEAVRLAVKPLNPPTISNILAIAALSGGRGNYTAEEIRRLLTIAYTGFRAAVLESRHAAGNKTKVVVHTGFWGCGAYGGNRVLMALLQLLAADLAHLDWLVFHAFNSAGIATVAEAGRRKEQIQNEGAEVQLANLIRRLKAMGFGWGVSDGN